MNVTAEKRDDFDVKMLKEVVENAQGVMSLVELVDENVKLAYHATRPQDPDKVAPDAHTRKLKAWDGFLDLYINRKELNLDSPEDIPFRVYFTEEECEAIYYRLRRTMDYVMALAKLWSKVDVAIDVSFHALLVDTQGK